VITSSSADATVSASADLSVASADWSAASAPVSGDADVSGFSSEGVSARKIANVGPDSIGYEENNLEKKNSKIT
jgi:hypothetical protein